MLMPYKLNQLKPVHAFHISFGEYDVYFMVKSIFSRHECVGFRNNLTSREKYRQFFDKFLQNGSMVTDCHNYHLIYASSKFTVK